MEIFILLPLVAVGGIVVGALFRRPTEEKLSSRITQLEKELDKKRYETLILSEVEDRIGISLDITKVADIIIGSLEKVIDYHTVSYLLLSSTNQVIFKCLVKESVGHIFVQDVEKRMRESFGAILDQDLTQVPLEKNVAGAILDDATGFSVGSFFHIPLVIEGKAVGIITVASPKQNLYTKENTVLLYAITNRASSIVSRMQGIMQREKIAQEKRRHEAERRAYQAEVLRELGERIGYSLDVVKIIEIITGTLGKLLEYHTVSSMIKTDKRIVFKSILKESINRAFVEDVKTKMIAAFSAMIQRQISQSEIDESITGTIFDENVKDPVRSFFNLPLIINKEVVGLITVASVKSGLYTEEETAILYTITAQASTAVTKLAQVLESEKGKLNALVASLNDGIIMVDPSWNLLVINPHARDMLGLSGNVTVLDVLDKLSGKIDLRTKIEEAIKSSSVVGVSDLMLDPFNLQVFVIPVKGKEKEVLGAVVVFHDVTREKELQGLRDQFEAMMIHDLRSPLTSIRGASDNLMRYFPTLKEEELTSSLKIIHDESVDMLQLVNDLLDVAKLDSGKFTIVKGPENLEKVIEEIVARTLPIAQQKNLQIQFESEGSLADVPLDEYRIKQVLMNLIANAIQYSDKGSIHVLAKRGDKEVTVSIYDNGVGIPKDQLGKLFTKFFQVQGGVRRKGGTGLGLVIAKGIVEAHGGRIWVESEENVGSKFFFTIPLKG